MQTYFDLIDNPFRLTLDPRYLYLAPPHRTAIAKADYTIENHQGLFIIYGETGQGKSSLIQHFDNRYSAQPNLIVHVINTPDFVSEMQFLKRICDGFGAVPRRSHQAQMDELHGFLRSQFRLNHTPLLLIDAAHQLVGPMFDLVEELLRLRADGRPLMQIVMCGEPNLRTKLINKPSVHNRISMHTNLDPLTFQDTEAMINYRIMVAGGGGSLFETAALKMLYEYTRGVPAAIIRWAAAALAAATKENRIKIDRAIIESVAQTKNQEAPSLFSFDGSRA